MPRGNTEWPDPGRLEKRCEGFRASAAYEQLSSAARVVASEGQSIRTALDSLRMDPGDVVRRVRSPQGRIVELTAQTWTYICKHAEMIERMDILLEAIERPTLQEPDVIAGRERYWLRVTKRFEFAWMRVVVEFAGETDRVVTAFGQNNPPAESRG